MPSIKPSVLLKTVLVFPSFSYLLGVLAFLFAIAKVRTRVVVCVDKGIAKLFASI